jgi:hypothetical protein
MLIIEVIQERADIQLATFQMEQIVRMGRVEGVM